MPARDLVREKVERLVPLDRPTECCTALHPRIRRLRTWRTEAHCERVHRLKIAIAQESEDVAVEIIGTGLGHNVHHAA